VELKEGQENKGLQVTGSCFILFFGFFLRYQFDLIVVITNILQGSQCDDGHGVITKKMVLTSPFLGFLDFFIGLPSCCMNDVNAANGFSSVIDNMSAKPLFDYIQAVLDFAV